jgi:hypothetical protein
MADPIIIIKENPGTLLIEAFDGDGNSAGTLRCPTIAFRTQDSELEIDGAKFKPKRNSGHGDSVEIKVMKVATR